MNINQSAVLKMIFTSAFLGSGTLIVKFVDNDALASAFWRLFLGAGIVLLILAGYRVLPKIDKRNFIFAVLSGFFLAIDLFLWHESILLIGPGIATILNSIQVFIIAIFSIIVYKEKLKLAFIAQMLMAFVGIVLLTGNEVDSNEQAVYGIIVGLLSGVAWASCVLFMKKLDSGESGKTGLLTNIFYLSLAGAVSLLPFTLFGDFSLAIINVKSLLGLLIYAGLIHVLGWILLADSVRFVPLSLTGLILLLEPTVALLLDIAILDKQVTLVQYIGAAITVFAIYLGTVSLPKPSNTH